MRTRRQGLMFGLVVVIAIVSPMLFFLLRVYPVHVAQEDILKRARQLIAKCPDYPANAAMLDELCVIAHERAIDASFQTSRSRINFDEPKYVGTLYSELVRQLGERGNLELSLSMQEEWKKGRLLPPALSKC